VLSKVFIYIPGSTFWNYCNNFACVFYFVYEKQISLGYTMCLKKIRSPHACEVCWSAFWCKWAVLYLRHFVLASTPCKPELHHVIFSVDLWRPNRTGTGFSANGSGFFCHLSLPRCSSFIRQTGEWTIGSLEEAVPRDRLKIPGEWKRIPLI